MVPSSLNSLAVISPVVPSCTPTVASPRSSTDSMSASPGASSDWSALKYGSEKSMRFSRSGVMVMEEIAASYWPFARPPMMPSKTTFWYSGVKPARLPTSFIRSMSNPTGSPSLSNSNGG